MDAIVYFYVAFVTLIATDTALEIEMRVNQWENFIMLKYYIVVIEILTSYFSN